MTYSKGLIWLEEKERIGGALDFSTPNGATGPGLLKIEV